MCFELEHHDIRQLKNAGFLCVHACLQRTASKEIAKEMLQSRSCVLNQGMLCVLLSWFCAVANVNSNILYGTNSACTRISSSHLCL